MKYLLPSLAAALCALAVTACGGGGGGGAAGGAPPPSTRTSDIPASATASVSGLMAYMKQLVGTSSDSGEPLFVGDAVLPTDDNIEPAN